MGTLVHKTTNFLFQQEGNFKTSRFVSRKSFNHSIILKRVHLDILKLSTHQLSSNLSEQKYKKQGFIFGKKLTKSNDMK